MGIKNPPKISLQNCKNLNYKKATQNNNTLYTNMQVLTDVYELKTTWKPSNKIHENRISQQVSKQHARATIFYNKVITFNVKNCTGH